jgi:endonuclease I
MKKIYLLVSALALSISAFAQAPVPTSYDFENGGTYPTGWTLNPLGTGTQYYTTTFACGGSAYSLKMDFDGENMVVALSSQPGTISYNIRANTGSTTPWNGDFQIQESVNGTTGWSTFKTYSGTGGAGAGGLDVNSCQAQTATPTNPNSRYIRFILVDKITGNVGIDDINIASPNVAVGIKVKQVTAQISNGGFTNPISSAVSGTTLLPLTVENIGSSLTLSVTSAVINGANASEFVATSTAPFNVNASSSTIFNINFTPTAAGTRTATLTYSTSDPNNSTFVIYLYGVGNGLASEPSAQATSLTFPINKTYRIKGQFNTASPAVDALGGYLILRNNNGTVTDVPVDGTTYQRGQYIGTSQVVFAGPILTSTGAFSPSYIRASKTYGFAIFTYNGSGTVTNYNTTSPLAGSVTTPFSMMPSTEYASINTNSTAFLTNLSALINPHTAIFYSNYTPTMIDRFETRDTLITSPVLFTRVVTCAYSGLNRTYNEPFDYSALDFSREHTYCHSWMPTFPSDNPEKPEYNDQHHLYPAKQVNVNAVRSNFPLGEVDPSKIASSYLACTSGSNTANQFVFEPRSSHKGNAARAIMYVATAYNGIAGNNWKLKNPISTTAPNIILYGQDQNLLKKWHFQDLPDSYDRSRNDFLDSLQGNRNPFVDSVRYACYIDFSNMTYIAYTGGNQPCYTAVGINENVLTQFEYVLAPNPTSGEFYLMIDAKISEKFNVYITDICGRNVYQKYIDVENGFNNILINDIKLNAGVYFVNLTYKNEKITRKLIIQ